MYRYRYRYINIYIYKLIVTACFGKQPFSPIGMYLYIFELGTLGVVDNLSCGSCPLYFIAWFRARSSEHVTYESLIFNLFLIFYRRIVYCSLVILEVIFIFFSLRVNFCDFLFCSCFSVFYSFGCFIRLVMKYGACFFDFTYGVEI